LKERRRDKMYTRIKNCFVSKEGGVFDFKNDVTEYVTVFNSLKVGTEGGRTDYDICIFEKKVRIGGNLVEAPFVNSLTEYTNLL
jgi:hypothetical protein